jgi:hypothetical protein
MNSPRARNGTPGRAISQHKMVKQEKSRECSPFSRLKRAVHGASKPSYLISVSILNIGRYIEMMITPTIRPTPIIMIGSTIEVRVCTEASTSSS